MCVIAEGYIDATVIDINATDVRALGVAGKRAHAGYGAVCRWATGHIKRVNDRRLGASGHIAGVINPAAKNKRSYWTGGKQGADPDQWLAGSSENPGSWWTHWTEWLAPMGGGDKVPARKKLGDKKHQEIEPAPGRYVKVRA